MARTRLLSLLLLPLCLGLFVGCTGDETAGPTTETAGAGSGEKPADPGGEGIVREASKPVASTLDLTYITDDFSSAIIVHPARVLNSEFVSSLADAGLPLQDGIQEVTEEIGVDPRKIAQIVMLFDNETVSAAPMMLPGFGPAQPPGGPAIEVDEFEAPDGATDSVPEESLEEEKAPESSDQGSLSAPTRTLQTVAYQPTTAAGGFGEAEEGAEPEFGPEMAGPPLPTVIVRFTEDINADEFFENLNGPPLEDAEIDGLKVKKTPFPEAALYFADAKTLIATPPKYLKKMVAAKSAESDLITELKNIDATHDLIIVADLAPVKPLVEVGAKLLEGMLPPDKAALSAIPAKTKMMTITAGIGNDSLMSLTLVMDSAQDVEAANQELTAGLKDARQVYAQQKSQGLPPDVPLGAAEQKELIRMADEIVAGISSTANGNRLTVSIPRPKNFNQLAATMKPAIEEAKRAAAESARKNNLRQIGLAFHNYHAVYNAFPGAGSDALGENKGLSWRVHLLPYLDQPLLYEQFNLDEPWDSDHNKALISQMPDVFKTEGVDDPTKTSLHVFVGESAFSLEQGKSIATYTDGTSNSLLVVEAAPDKAEVWTRPGGLTLIEDAPLSSLGSLTGDSFLALFADGFVRSISTSIDPETLKAIITINGGEVVGEF